MAAHESRNEQTTHSSKRGKVVFLVSGRKFVGEDADVFWIMDACVCESTQRAVGVRTTAFIPGANKGKFARDEFG